MLVGVTRKMGTKRVMVSGCFDLVHAGHVEFLRRAAKFGDLHVVIGTDANVELLKNVRPTYDQNERKFIVENLAVVTCASVATGTGVLDFEDDLKRVRPDVFVVNEDGDTPEKQRLCESLGVAYEVLKRVPHPGLPARSSSALRGERHGRTAAPAKVPSSGTPQRLCLAGGWIDQPYVNAYAPGSVTVAQIERRDALCERAGLASSTSRVWNDLRDKGLRDDVAPDELARMLFYLENGRELLFGYQDPERREGYLSGSQDHIGLTHPGVSRLDYEHSCNKGYWPAAVEATTDRGVCDWLQSHLVLVPIGERSDGYDPLVERNFSRERIERLGRAGRDCYAAILNGDLERFGRSLTQTHDAWREILPRTTSPEIDAMLDRYGSLGAGRTTSGCGGGYVMIATERDPDDVPGGFGIRVRTA